MTRRAKHRGARLPGLFGFDDGAPTDELEEVPDNPLARRCPTCHAPPIEPCTRPGRGFGGRVKKTSYCEARTKPTTEETS